MTYKSKVLSYSPIAYWPLDEISGLIADNAEGTAARDGTFSGSGFLNQGVGPDNSAVPLFDGTNDYVDIFSASLETAFNEDEFTVIAWARVSDGNWEDGSTRRVFGLFDDASNEILIGKLSGGEIRFSREAGGTTINRDTVVQITTDWLFLALTASQSGDVQRVFVDGLQLGGDQSGLAAWTGGGWSTERVAIGCFDISPVANAWSGNIAHVAIFDYPLTVDDIADLFVIPAGGADTFNEHPWVVPTQWYLPYWKHR